MVMRWWISFLCLRRADQVAILLVIIAWLGYLAFVGAGWKPASGNLGNLVLGPGWQCSNGPYPICWKEPARPPTPAPR
jgi:hypothetical protein